MRCEQTCNSSSLQQPYCHQYHPYRNSDMARFSSLQCQGQKQLSCIDPSYPKAELETTWESVKNVPKTGKNSNEIVDRQNNVGMVSHHI